MNIKPIKTEQDYEAALKRIDELMEAEPDTPAGDELEVLTTLVLAYEEKHYPIAPPDPVEAILFRMEQMGLTRKDLEALIGGRGRIAEVLNRKRGLSLATIRRLYQAWQIPLESLIGRT